jgi:Domain of unknown function (DUF6468)
MTLQVFLDVVVAILLVVAIGAAIVLNRRFAAFRAARADFERFIEQFNMAAARAEAGVNTLKTTGDATGRALQMSISQAQTLRDELTFLIERAGPMIDRLTSAHRTAADAARAATPAAEPARAKPAMQPAKAAAQGVPPRAEPAAGPAGDSDLLKTLSSLR